MYGKRRKISLMKIQPSREKWRFRFDDGFSWPPLVANLPKFPQVNLHSQPSSCLLFIFGSKQLMPDFRTHGAVSQ